MVKLPVLETGLTTWLVSKRFKFLVIYLCGVRDFEKDEWGTGSSSLATSPPPEITFVNAFEDDSYHPYERDARAIGGGGGGGLRGVWYTFIYRAAQLALILYLFLPLFPGQESGWLPSAGCLKAG